MHEKSSNNRITSTVIAEQLGISQATVSRALAGNKRISENTRNKVLAVAKEIGYCRNELARAMVTGSSRIIALVSSLAVGRHEYISQIMVGISEELSKRGYSLKIFYMADDNEVQIIRQIRENRIAGVICHAVEYRELAELIKELRNLKIPTVTANLSADKFGIGVVSDDANGIEQAVDYLYQCGHRRIAYLGSPRNVEFTRNRRLGFGRGMERYGLEARYYTDFQEKTHILADQIYNDGYRAVIAEADTTAALLMQWAYRRGIAVPDEWSVVGFSNASFTNLCMVPLTTVAQPLDELGSITARELLNWVESKSEKEFDEVSNIVVPVKLLVRESVSQITK